MDNGFRVTVATESDDARQKKRLDADLNIPKLMSLQRYVQ